jgi:hypothetical protein
MRSGYFIACILVQCHSLIACLLKKCAVLIYKTVAAFEPKIGLVSVVCRKRIT